MAAFDTATPVHNDVVQHRSDEGTKGMGERDYAERVKANRPTISERLIIIAALALLATAGITAHFGGPIGSAVDAATVGSVEPQADLEYCREHSPYADRSC